MTSHRCPFVTTDKEMITRYLRPLSLQELIFVVGDLQSRLGLSDQKTYDINRYCSAYADIEGRINFIIALV